MRGAPPFTEPQLRTAIRVSLCWSDVLRALGLGVSGNNSQTVRKWARRWEISTGHFDPAVGQRRGTRTRSVPLEDVLVENSTYSRGHLKRRLYAEGLKQPICEMCGQTEEWQGRRMSLILDHVNGVGNDHRIENLRIVCPNCAATLDTHCGRNPVLKLPRLCLTCESEFLPKYPQHRYCSPGCADTARSAAARGIPHPDQRKVARPPYEQLMAELATSNYSAVGRKYGVSDNAVRKWVRWYEAERERAAA